MPIYVVIPSKNIANLRPCVTALAAAEPELDLHQIIVVDDCENEDIRLFAEEAGLTRIVGEKPFVFARNANLGLRLAFGSGAHGVFLLNDDALLTTSHGFTNLSELWSGNREYGLLSPACNNVGNKNQQPCGDAGVRREHRSLCFIAPFIPKPTWDLVGELEEDFTGYGYEDVSYSLRTLEAGLKLGVWDGCFVDHSKLTPTFRNMPSNAQDRVDARQIFLRKWAAKLEQVGRRS